MYIANKHNICVLSLLGLLCTCCAWVYSKGQKSVANPLVCTYCWLWYRKKWRCRVGVQD